MATGLDPMPRSLPRSLSVTPSRSVLVALALFLAATALLLPSAFAYERSPAYNQGAEAFGRRDYRAAVQAFRQAAQEQPNDAKSHYALGKTLAELRDYPNAVREFDTAQTLDSSLSFAKSPDFFLKQYAEARRLAAGGAPPGPSTRRSVPTGRSAPSEGMNGTASGSEANTPLLRALSNGAVFVAPGMEPLVDEAQLKALVERYRPQIVRIAVLNSVSGNRDQFAAKLFNYLGLPGEALLVVVTRQGVALHTGSLNSGALQRLASENAVKFTDSYSAGIQSLLDSAIQAKGATRKGRSATWIVLLALGLGGFVFLRNRKTAATESRIVALNRDINHRLDEVTQEFRRFDIETASAPDTPLLQEAKQLRSAAVDPFAAAGEQFNTAKTLPQYEEADRLTEQAERLAAKARARLEQAMGRKPLDDPNVPGGVPRAEDVPADDRGACFFCSKPARLRDLTPLEVNVNGESQRVLACEDCADIAHTGRSPQVLTVPDDQGHNVPWYQSNRYDPWNDYGRGGMLGGRGFGLMDYLMLDTLLNHGMRSNNTVIYPQDPGYAQQYDNAPMGGVGGQDAQESGSGGFFGDLFGNSNASESGSGGFFGSGDSGGDSGGGIFSGNDLGGGDSGGGDIFSGNDL